VLTLLSDILNGAPFKFDPGSPLVLFLLIHLVDEAILTFYIIIRTSMMIRHNIVYNNEN
jgi:hypothetical protein